MADKIHKAKLFDRNWQTQQDAYLQEVWQLRVPASSGGYRWVLRITIRRNFYNEQCSGVSELLKVTGDMGWAPLHDTPYPKLNCVGTSYLHPHWDLFGVDAIILLDDSIALLEALL